MSTTKRSERGAVLVEAAIVSTLFFTIVFLIFQGALFSRSYLAASDAATAGARAGGVGAQEPLADWDILNAISRSVTSASPDHIEKIIVFRATGPGYEMPPGCMTGPTSSCNHYNGSDLGITKEDFMAASYSKNDNWPSSGRSADTEKLGVYVSMKSGGIGGPVPQQVAKTGLAGIEVG